MVKVAANICLQKSKIFCIRFAVLGPYDNKPFLRSKVSQILDVPKEYPSN